MAPNGNMSFSAIVSAMECIQKPKREITVDISVQKTFDSSIFQLFFLSVALIAGQDTTDQ